jgi:CBS domain-containing protein
VNSKYSTLNSHPLVAGTTYHRPPQRLPERVTLDEPATNVMTDFRQVAAITMGPCATIDDAEQRMLASGVRLLLVTDQANRILGVLTLTDINGDRPLKYLKEVGGKRGDIYLRDIMTPQDQLETLYMVDVANACVGDIVATLERSGRQHALVVDLNEDRQQVVRGLFSTKQIGKQLGTYIETREVATTLAAVAGLRQ